MAAVGTVGVGVSPSDDIFAGMTVQALDTAVRYACDFWAIEARATPLTGERDRNFHLKASDGREFVMKIANPAEDPGVSAMQIAALQHIERVDPELSTPRIVPTAGGGVEAAAPREGGGTLRVRLLSWIAGESLAASRRSAAQRIACGEMLARLQLALADFSHPAAAHPLIWDLQHALRLREVLFALPHAPAREVVGEILDAFEEQVTPRLSSLRRQVVHNDMNHLNTLVDQTDHDRIAGLIDFGDMVETAIVIDVATGAFPQLAPDMRTVDALAHFVRGFHRVRPLVSEEVDLLPLLIAARFGMSLVLQAWHRRIQPENAHYSVLTNEEIESRLAAISEIRSSDTLEALRRACGFR
jgi:hydroxylysine kinase